MYAIQMYMNVLQLIRQKILNMFELGQRSRPWHGFTGNDLSHGPHLSNINAILSTFQKIWPYFFI